MNNFEFYNPVHILFGKGQITNLKTVVPANTKKILLIYGGGSIKKNGVYTQVKDALSAYAIEEFSGVEANPEFTTLMKAVEIVRAKNIDFILAIGGGSVIDGTKFVSAAAKFQGDTWDILSKASPVREVIPFGCIQTLPATGSEMNCFSVISRSELKLKLSFMSPLVYPKFSILDPMITLSLPERQVCNGIVDAFVHVTEQYLTHPAEIPLQDRMCEAVLSSLIEVGPKILKDPNNYQLRATGMWCTTMALNGVISVGAPQDWATHMIGHELTAIYGIDHARTLAIVLPSLLRNQLEHKAEKLAQMGKRIWQLNGSDLEIAQACINEIESFFHSMKIPTKLKDYPEANTEKSLEVVSRLKSRNMFPLGDKRSIQAAEVESILKEASL